MEYTIESLIGMNARYHHEHRVSESDVQKANRIVQVIESTRSDAGPRVGDIVQYTTKHGDYYPRAHIENLNDDGRWVICEQPYVPFVTVERGTVHTNTSGGAWASIPANPEFVGVSLKAFIAWGHCGQCAGGAFTVYAQVNVWRHTDGNPEFSTEHYHRFDVMHHDKPVGCGYIVTVRKDQMAHTAFPTEAEYLRWLESIGGVERPAAWEKARIVWAKKS